MARSSSNGEAEVAAAAASRSQPSVTEEWSSDTGAPADAGVEPGPDGRDERRDDIGVELRARAADELVACGLDTHRPVVGPRRRHRREGVAGADDAGGEWDLLAPSSSG